MKKRLIGAALAGLAMLAAGGASAEMKSALTGAELEAVLAEAGLSPVMGEDEGTGAPIASGKLGEIVFWVRAFDCNGRPAACETLMFFANFDLGRSATPKDYVILNNYNDGKVFGRAYLIEAKSQVGVDYVIELSGGVSMEHLSQNIARWADIVGAFIDNFREGSASS